MLLYTPPRAATSIPVVDLARSFGDDRAAQAKVAEAIHRACRDTGFFYVSNHNVRRDMIAAQFTAAKQFFDLPVAEKLAIDMKKSPTSTGYEPIGGQTLDSQDDDTVKAPPDLKESFYCGLELPDDDPRARSMTRCFGHNQWPRDLPGFREQMIGYYEAMTGLGAHLLRMLALSLDMPADWFAKFHSPASSTLRLIKYPPQAADAAFNQIGAGAHTDWGGITILAQDDVGGLEVKTLDGDWIAAPPVPDTFIINLGELMKRWTNGIYMANMHRVKNNAGTKDRYSIPFFYGPYPTSVIEAIPSCVGEHGAPRYEVCTAQDHMTEMFKRSYGYTPVTAVA